MVWSKAPELSPVGATLARARSLGIEPGFRFGQSPPPTHHDRHLLGDRQHARPKLRRESASLRDRARLTQRSKVRALRYNTIT